MSIRSLSLDLSQSNPTEDQWYDASGSITPSEAGIVRLYLSKVVLYCTGIGPPQQDARFQLRIGTEAVIDITDLIKETDSHVIENQWWTLGAITTTESISMRLRTTYATRNLVRCQLAGLFEIL